MKDRAPRLRPLALALAFAVLLPGAARAGVWSELPEAVNSLLRDSSDQDARTVLLAAETMVVREAKAGHLSSAAMLAEVYEGVIHPLPDGELRSQRFRQRVTRALLSLGDRLLDEDAEAAGRAWTLAAELSPEPGTIERLARLIHPPAAPTAGAVWVSPVDGAEMVWHPPFQYRLGCSPTDRNCQRDERFFRWVTMGGVWVERAPVTNAQYQLCVEAGACQAPHSFRHSPPQPVSDHPVVGVSWRQARRYALWAGRRLLSEAEWERAARGRTHEQRFPWGNRRSRERANVLGTVGPDSWEGPSPVASFPANGYDLYDMAGNVWEWVEDSYHRNAMGAPADARPWISDGFGRVLRGGSWRQPLEAARVSARTWDEEDYVADDVGFRTGMDPRSELQPSVLVSRAQESFPLERNPEALARSDELDGADRRYLERRALTWLALEGRAVDGLPYAARMLERDAEEAMAVDLVNRAEAELVEYADGVELEALRRGLRLYRQSLGRLPRLSSRVEAFEARMVAELEDRGQRLLQAGDDLGARRCFNLALELRPQNAGLALLRDAAEPEPGQSRVWPGDGREMVWIPGGSFLMGASPGDRQAAADEHPATTVRVEGFWLDRAPVTNAQYRRCVDDGVCTPPGRTEAYQQPELANHPVLWVDWYQARIYAGWADKRLPSEAERERAVRAGATARYPWGAEWVEGAGNLFGTGGSDRFVDSSPVAAFPPSRWNALDLVGNAWEWVADVYHRDYRGCPLDGRPWTQTTDHPGPAKRVLRGASFSSQPVDARVSARSARDPDNPNRTTGFRCAADAD